MGLGLKQSIAPPPPGGVWSQLRPLSPKEKIQISIHPQKVVSATPPIR